MVRGSGWFTICLIAAMLLPLRAGEAGDPPRARGLLLVANKYDHTLGIVDPDSGEQVATVGVDVTGHEVAASPDGRRAYVPIYGDSGVGQAGSDGRTLHVIDIASRHRIATIDFGKPTRPHDAKFGPKGLLYVTTELTNSIEVINPRTNKIVSTLPTGQPESHMLAITHDGKRIYTSNAHSGTVSVIDVANRKVLAVIPVSKYAQRISLSVDEHLAFTADQTKPQLAVIDTATNRVKTWVSLPAVAYGTAATRDGRWLLAALSSANKIAVIDLGSMKVARTVEVAEDPQEILVRPDNEVAYVSSHVGKISVVNLKTWQVDKFINVGKGSDGLAWAPKK
jgi:YVTN family beta-propeller protein